MVKNKIKKSKQKEGNGHMPRILALGKVKACFLYGEEAPLTHLASLASKTVRTTGTHHHTQCNLIEICFLINKPGIVVHVCNSSPWLSRVKQITQ